MEALAVVAMPEIPKTPSAPRDTQRTSLYYTYRLLLYARVCKPNSHSLKTSMPHHQVCKQHMLKANKQM